MNTEQLQEMFFDMMEAAEVDQPITEGQDSFDEALAIYQAVEEFFVENYRHLTIDEQVVAVVRGIDVNEDLYAVIADALLDESIGSAIATVVHGVGQRVAAHKASRAAATAVKKGDVAHQKGSLAAKRTLVTKQTDKANKGGVVDTFKSAYHRARSDKSYSQYLKAKDDKAAAISKSQSADDKLKAKQQKRADLGSKIDARVNKAKQAVKSGLKKTAGFAGRLIGRFA